MLEVEVAAMPSTPPAGAGQSWLQRYWLPAALALFMLLAVVLFLQYRDDPARPAALLGFLAAMLLLGVTAEYVRTNQQSLRLLREHLRRQDELGIKFSVRPSRGRARVQVANIGAPTAIVTRAVVRAQHRKPLTLHKHLIVPSGGRRGFFLPDALWSGALQRHLEITLHYESALQRARQTRAYTLFLTTEGQVHRVVSGLRSLWPVTCPNCGAHADLYMRTDDLDNFDDAFARQERMRFHLSQTCPKHDSPWRLEEAPPAGPFGPIRVPEDEWHPLPPAASAGPGG